MKLREIFKLKSLLGSSIVPLLAFLLLGYIQRHVYDWSQLHNNGYERGIEIAGYLSVYVVLYMVSVPLFWLRPQLKAKIYKEGSAQAQPEISQVFDLAHRERVADVTVELEFTPNFIARNFIERLDKQAVGIKFQWNPSKLFSCSSRYEGDKEFSIILDNGVHLFPFEKMNLSDSESYVKYSFRFALGTTEVVQRTKLKAKHLNWKSRVLFGLHCETEFLFEIKDSRPQSLPPSVG
ncbi:MAG: hypothetical protein DMF64_12535 [Acidobacteria bacterium]|nr:MAG: hypothetical protein DMF64_12535 [Acidobacteriota bacterium]